VLPRATGVGTVIVTGARFAPRMLQLWLSGWQAVLPARAIQPTSRSPTEQMW
jgi:hypothetical protein